MTNIDIKINKLIELVGCIPYVEYYSHGCKTMYKIDNPFTHYTKDVIVLCEVDEGFECSLDLALETVQKAKIEFYGSGSV